MTYIEGGRGAVVMINANDNSGVLGRIFEAIADQYAWPDFPHRKPPQAIEDKAPEASAIIVSLQQKLADGAPLRDLLTTELAAELEKQRDDLRQEFATYGAYQKVELLRVEEKNGERSYRHRLIFERGNLIVRSTFNAEGRIIRLNIQPE